MRIIAIDCNEIDIGLSIVAFDPQRKNYRRYNRSKGLFNKKTMRILNRRKKSGKKTAMQKFCRGNMDESCVMRAMKSNNPSLRKSANFVQTMRKIAGRKVGSKDKNSMAKRKRADKLYNLHHRQTLKRENRARIIGNRKGHR